MLLPRMPRAVYTSDVLQPIRVALVEDQAATREGLSLLISDSPGFQICGLFASMEDALEQIHNVAPHVLLADIGLPGMSGIEGVRRIHSLLPELPVLMLTVHGDSDSVFSAVCAGACGYLLKETPPARLLEAIRELHEGGAPMSPSIARKVVLMFQKIAPAEPRCGRQKFCGSSRRVIVTKPAPQSLRLASTRSVLMCVKSTNACTYIRAPKPYGRRCKAAFSGAINHRGAPPSHHFAVF